MDVVIRPEGSINDLLASANVAVGCLRRHENMPGQGGRQNFQRFDRKIKSVRCSVG